MQTRTTLILTLTIIITFAAGSAFGSYSGGTGEPNDPYQIASKEDLLTMAADTNDYNQCFILTADIDMESQVFTTAIIAPDTVSGNYSFEGTAFKGTFDGNGHKITGFTINGGSNWFLGLFGQIGSGGSVKNLGIENCSVSGISNSYNVGGLVGINYGSITNCYSTGAVSGSQDIGGLAGGNHGNISNCYATGTVSGAYNVGGLVGANDSGSSISNCYSTGSVSGSDFVGGLLGANYPGNVSNCYSTGSVSGSHWVGGLVGKNYGSIYSCYSTGAVSGTSSVGGLVGWGGALGSFWDTNTSGQTTSAGGTGKTTAEMKTLATFTLAEWDFVDTWGIGNGQTYPYLKPFNGFSPADLNYSGTVDFADFTILAENWLSGE